MVLTATGSLENRVLSPRSKIHPQNDGHVENLLKIIKDALPLRMVFKVPKRIFQNQLVSLYLFWKLWRGSLVSNMSRPQAFEPPKTSSATAHRD